MTDRELLELAAKAAGLRVLPLENRLRDCTNAHHPAMNMFAMPIWDPLTDDGDALRLAVKLQIHHEIFIGYTIAQYVDPQTDDWVPLEEWGNDPYAATRRAIVRAAAEIGRTA